MGKKLYFGLIFNFLKEMGFVIRKLIRMCQNLICYIIFGLKIENTKTFISPPSFIWICENLHPQFGSQNSSLWEKEMENDDPLVQYLWYSFSFSIIYIFDQYTQLIMFLALIQANQQSPWQSEFTRKYRHRVGWACIQMY